MSAMLLRRLILWLSFLGVLAFPAPALAVGGRYVFVGGTPAERAQVLAALDASSFDWSVVPQTITIHIARGVESEARPGQIWLSSALVDSGRFSWGTIQHEYAHQVDYFLLDPVARAALTTQLGGFTWWTRAELPHAWAGAERFASTLAWAYWPSADNALRPTSRYDEAAALPPPQFRALVSRLLNRPGSDVQALHR
jgi:hypothetical protein